MYLDDPEADAQIMMNMMHDLKTPISAVRGFLELMGYSGELNERQKMFQERAFAGLERMEMLVHGFLDMNRVRREARSEFMECSFGDIIRETVEMVEYLAKARNITIQTEIAPDLENVLGHPHQLVQVVDNLLSNAIKYNLEGGDVYVSAKNHDGFVHLEVRDTGAGITVDEQQSIFEPFFRSRKMDLAAVEGSGLGLAIVRMIVEQHHGHIGLESQAGVGTVFHVSIPHRPHQEDGHDLQQYEPDSGLREGRDLNDDSSAELPLERSDAVADNLQESNDSVDVDSSSDLL